MLNHMVYHPAAAVQRAAARPARAPKSSEKSRYMATIHPAAKRMGASERDVVETPKRENMIAAT
jgi:hypothetical protein